jgi:hypothetical protein
MVEGATGDTAKVAGTMTLPGPVVLVAGGGRVAVAAGLGLEFATGIGIIDRSC